MDLVKKDFEKFCEEENVVILVDAKRSGEQYTSTFKGTEVSIGWFLRNIKNAKKVAQ